MRQPPYHLRFNKAVDRLLWLATIDGFLGAVSGSASDYQYVGFGGPFMEDFRLLARQFPELPMISLERNQQIWLRQRRHKPSRLVRCLLRDLRSYVATSEPTRPVIAWLDFTGLQIENLQEYIGFLEWAPEGSLIKITLRAEFDGCGQTPNEFAETFRGYLEPPPGQDDLRRERFPLIVERMIRVASERALGEDFLLLHSAYYSDGVYMLGVTGARVGADAREQLKAGSKRWRHSTRQWGDPQRLAVPVLSVAERLALAPLLPNAQKLPKALRRRLGYRIDDSEKSGLDQLRQYALYATYYPLFMKVDV